MPCERITLDNGATAIVCSRGKRKFTCACGRPGARECDWKVRRLKSGKWKTCDTLLCLYCTTVPAPDKDLCPKHAAEWKARLAQKEAV